MRKLGLIVLASLAALAAAATIAACGSDDGGSGGDAKAGGSITISQSSQPDYLDPALAYTVNAWEPMWLVYTPPLTYKRAEGQEGTELIPGVATDLPKISNGGKTYTFAIRKGLKYADGSPVKASDWEHTIKRVLNLESGGAPFFEVIEGADAYVNAGRPQGDISGIETNDQTGEVTVNLTKADGTFPNVMAMNFSGIVPGDTSFRNLSKDPPPGVGPYTITRSVPNREFVMEKSRSFDIPGIPKGNIDKITTKIVESGQRQAQNVINGELDYMQDPPPTDLLPEVRSKYKDRYEEHVTVSTYYFFMNHRVPPFDKKEVRQAVNNAVDSRALARIFGGRLAPSCNFLPPNMVGYEEVDCPYGEPGGEPNLDKARQQIEQAGADGQRIDVYTNNDPTRPEIGQYLADTLDKIGLRPDLKTVDGGVYFATLGNEKTRPPIGFANWFQDFPHPANFFFLVDGETIQPTNTQNFGRVDDPQLNQLIDRVEAAADPKEVTDVSAEIDRRLVEEAHVAPYGNEKLSTFMSERMDIENCSLFHPLYLNDYSSFCLK